MKRYIFIGLLAALICSVSVNGVFADLSDGLVAYYPFNGSADDASGNGLHGTLVEGDFTENRFGEENSALSAGFVEVSDDARLDFTDAFTLSAWLKLEEVVSAFNCWIGKDYTTAFACGIGSGGSGECPAGDEINRIMRLYIGDVSTSFMDGTDFSCGTDTWYHVVVTFDDESDTAQLYVNGSLDDTVAISGTVTPNDYPLGIGEDGFYSDDFAGIIDEVRIHDRVLDSEEVEALYALNEADDSSGGGGSSSGCFVSTVK